MYNLVQSGTLHKTVYKTYVNKHFEVDFFTFFRSQRLVNYSLLLKGSSCEMIRRTGSGVQEAGQKTVKFTVIRYSIRQQRVGFL